MLGRRPLECSFQISPGERSVNLRVMDSSWSYKSLYVTKKSLLSKPVHLKLPNTENFKCSSLQCADMDMVKLWQLECLKAYNTIKTLSEQQLREINLKSQIFMVIYQTGDYSGVVLTNLEEFGNTVKLFQVSSTRWIFLVKTKTNEKTKKHDKEKCYLKLC